MIDDCVAVKVSPPVIKYDSSEFVIEFKKDSETILGETVDKTGVKTRVKTGVKTRVKTGEKTREKIREKIITLIKGNEAITAVELAGIFGLTIKGIEYHLSRLKKDKVIDRIGPVRGGKWVVLK